MVSLSRYEEEGVPRGVIMLGSEGIEGIEGIVGAERPGSPSAALDGKGICRIISPTDLETADCVASAEQFGIDVVKLRDTPERAAWRDDLAATEREIEAVNRQKRGLMQKLLTGEWRVEGKDS